MTRITSFAAFVFKQVPLAPSIILTYKEDDVDKLSQELAPLIIREVRRALLPPIPLLIKPFRRFDKLKMITAILPTPTLFDLGDDPKVRKIFVDRLTYIVSTTPTVQSEGIYTVKGKKYTSTFWTRKLVGADKADAKGIDGSGIKVGVVDTGVLSTHEQLAGVVEYASSELVAEGPLDYNGHGTWVASCIAGKPVIDRAVTGIAGKPVMMMGVARRAKIYSVKGLGYGLGFGSDSSVIASIYHLYSVGVDLINMSLGSYPPAATVPEDDPYYYVFEELKAKKIIPVVAAGNNGPNPATVASPGWLPNALTVGAYDPITGQVAEYSSRGPTPDGRIKPDVIAPGGGFPDHGIYSATSIFLDGAGDKIRGDLYAPIQGTSMATPHVAGLIALAKQAWRKYLGKELTLDEIFDILKAKNPAPNPVTGYGALTWDDFQWWLETQYSVKL